jgi:hypothetical protein
VNASQCPTQKIEIEIQVGVIQKLQLRLRARPDRLIHFFDLDTVSLSALTPRARLFSRTSSIPKREEDSSPTRLWQITRSEA